MTDSTLTAERLRELLRYDHLTGVFLRRIKTSRKVRVGDVAGGLQVDGSIGISIDNRLYRAHRLAWLYTHGVWPADQIDHINGNPADNRLRNLREATNAQNVQNKSRPQSNNRTSRMLGVTRNASGNWQAAITVRRKTRYLGSFATPEEAQAAYLKAKAELHPFWADAA